MPPSVLPLPLLPMPSRTVSGLVFSKISTVMSFSSNHKTILGGTGPQKGTRKPPSGRPGCSCSVQERAAATQIELRPGAAEGPPLPGVLQPGGHAVDCEEHEAADPLVGLLIGAVGAAKSPQG